MKLMVIDGNSILNRAFYGVKPLSTQDGTPTHAIFGFLNILLKLLEEEQPEGVCVAFDVSAPTFRHLAYTGYKATRKPMPNDLAVQMPILKDVLHAMNVPTYEMDGWEADDLLGTIAARDEAAGWDTVIVTGDRDALQLITEHTTVKLVSTRMGRTTVQEMTPTSFREKYGFEPIHLVDCKALMGDASDNIPGVKGVGEKTALGLIQLYGTLDHLYDHMPDICSAPNTPAKPALIQKLAAGKAQAALSYDLATIRRDAPLTFQPEDAKRQEPDTAALTALFVKLEFSKLLARFGLDQPDVSRKGTASFSNVSESDVVTEQERVEELLTLWRGKDHVSVLTLPDLNGVCVVWAEACGKRAAVFLPEFLACYNDFLRQFFSPDIPKVAHGVKDLMGALLDEGLSVEGFCFDTELAAYLLAPADGSYALDKLGMSYFHVQIPSADVYRAPDAFAPLLTGSMTADAATPQGVLTTHTALIDALYDELSKQIAALGLHRVLYEIELPLCPILAEMQRAGVLVDRNALAAYGVMLDERMEASENAAYALAGQKFNLNSTQQLGKVLFEQLQLPPVKKTKTGYSTSVEVLEKLRGLHPIIDVILEYRQYAKLKSTYVDGMIKVIAPDGRIHTSFQNTATATGRLSSAEPNLQNIPVRTELGAKLREMFVAAPGNVLVDADYSQIELRVLAHIAKDAAMQKAFQSDTDIHTETAAQVFGIPPEQVNHEMRRRAKAVNFGIVYGISAFSLSQEIGVTTTEAKEYMDRYFATFSGVRDYMDRVVKQAKKDGYVSTELGRRRWLPELKSVNHNLRAFGERVALNTPIQGTAADVMKIAMIRVAHALRTEKLRAKLILQVHDELIVECPEEEAEQVKTLLCREMKAAADFDVPMRADAGIGRSWGEAKN